MIHNGKKRKREPGAGASGEGGRKHFFSGVLILSLSTVVVKIIGMLYKIPMLKLLGAEGMGYYNSAYELYALFFVISTAGLPTAISMMVSQSVAAGRSENAQKIYRSALWLFFAIGLSGSFFLFRYAEGLATLIGNPGAAASVRAIAPALLFISLSGVLRGYFQGCQNMTPTALSQLIESAAKLLFGLGFALYAKGRGADAPTVAMYAVIGLTLGIVLSALYLWGIKRLGGKRERSGALVATDSTGDIFRRMIAIAIPITLSASVMSVIRLLDMSMILHRLQDIGYSPELTNILYGNYSTMAIPVYSLPASLIGAIALPVVPMMASFLERDRREGADEIMNAAFRIGALVAIPCSLGITVFSEPILNLIFAKEGAAVAYTAPLLAVLGLSIFFSCMITLTNAVLQAYRQVYKPILSIAVGAVAKLILSYVLIGMPSVHMYGAPISTLVCDVVIVCLNLYFISQNTSAVGEMLRRLPRTLLSAALSIVGAVIVYYLFRIRGEATPLTLPAAIAAAGGLFFFLAWKLRVFLPEDLALFPGGGKIKSLISKKVKVKNHE